MKCIPIYFASLLTLIVGQNLFGSLIEEPVFSKLPSWEQGHHNLEPLKGGCSNQNYILTIGDKRYFVRKGAESRKVLGLSAIKEQEAMTLGAKLGIAPAVLAADVDQDILITQFIESETINIRDKKQLAKLIELLKKLHTSNGTLSASATPEDMITFYLMQLEQLNIPLTEVQKRIIAARPVLQLDPLVPCHMDLKNENVLDDGTRLWLIDWEYAGMSDPLFDLASLAPNNNFTDEEMEIALELYVGAPSDELKQRFYQMRILADLRIALWCLLQSKISILDCPYDAWVDEMFGVVESRLKKCGLLSN